MKPQRALAPSAPPASTCPVLPTTTPPRFLHRRGFPAYTHLLNQAMTAEPEALSAADQDTLTRAAHDQQLRVWHTSHTRLLAELEHLATHVQHPHARRTARAVRRELDALDRKLDEQ